MKKLLLILSLIATTAYSQEMTGPAGNYIVKAPDLVKVTWGDGWVLFRWSNPNPGPGPGPNPDPGPPIPPPPTPKAKNTLFISLIHEPDVDQKTILIRDKLATSDLLKTYDAHFRTYTTEQKEALDRIGLSKYIKKLPCIIVQEQSDNGKFAPVRSDGLIETFNSADDILNYLKSLR